MSQEAVGTIYLASYGQEQLSQAQQAITEHLGISMGGRCLKCGGLSPCAALMAANATFARYGRLPRRTPGATVPAYLRRVA